MSRILVVDDDAAIGRSLELQLSAQGHEVQTYTSAAHVAERPVDWRPEVALVDLRLPDGDGLSIMGEIRQRTPACAVVIITGQQDMQATIQAIKQGAFDYLRKPLNFDDVLLVIEKATVRQAEAPREESLVSMPAPDLPAREIVGGDRKIIDVLKQIGLLSESRVTVLIQGETGTGKELVARALHDAGAPGTPFVPINCSSVVATLMESELFGHEKGAFTGAEARKLGRLEVAREGTVFLDEIGDLSLDLQAKLLRALQEREFCRVGGTEPVSLRAAILAATHQDLDRLIARGRFREDLYYRLAVARLSMPPLRERRGDIPLLVEHLLASINRQLHKSVSKIPESLMKQFLIYEWPGNVRELENILMRGVALATGDTLDPEVLQFPPPGIMRPADADDVKTLREVERDHLAATLALMGWNITHTSRALDISPPTLRKKIADYDLQPPA